MKTQELYRNPRLLGAASGKRQLKNVRKLLPSLKLEDLEAENSYTLFKPVNYKFQRAKITVAGINDCWQMDLLDLQKLNYQNKGFKYLLTIIDVFSRYGMAIPIKNKTGAEIVRALTIAFKERGTPEKVFTDKGLEFVQAQVRAFLVSKNVHPMTYTFGNIKASAVERFNRTIRERLERVFYSTGGKNWVDYIESIVNAYNLSKSRAHGMRPAEVNEHNELQVWKTLYPEGLANPKFPPLFQVGDTVRTALAKPVFEKGYTQKWSDEVFAVRHIVPKTNLYVYKLTDVDGNDVPGNFYKEQLQKVSPMIAAGIFKRIVKSDKNDFVVEFVCNGETVQVNLPKRIFDTPLNELYLS